MENGHFSGSNSRDLGSLGVEQQQKMEAMGSWHLSIQEKMSERRLPKVIPLGPQGAQSQANRDATTKKNKKISTSSSLGFRLGRERGVSNYSWEEEGLITCSACVREEKKNKALGWGKKADSSREKMK